MLGLRSFAPRSLAAALLLAGCGGNVVVDETSTGNTGTGGGAGANNPIVGTWTASTEGDPSVTLVLTFSADGTYSEARRVKFFADTMPCPGAVHLAGTWSSTATTLMLGAATCTGSDACPNGYMLDDCDSLDLSPGSETYTLSDGNDMLTLQGGPEPVTFTRK
jgi:hypothetical protein